MTSSSLLLDCKKNNLVRPGLIVFPTRPCVQVLCSVSLFWFFSSFVLRGPRYIYWCLLANFLIFFWFFLMVRSCGLGARWGGSSFFPPLPFPSCFDFPQRCNRGLPAFHFVSQTPVPSAPVMTTLGECETPPLITTALSSLLKAGFARILAVLA